VEAARRAKPFQEHRRRQVIARLEAELAGSDRTEEAAAIA
jgi:hypothetical protein